MKELCSFIFI